MVDLYVRAKNDAYAVALVFLASVALGNVLILFGLVIRTSC
jgi:hypothetical protein